MPAEIDPASFQLALLLTAAGATVGATIIASIIEAAKRIPRFGAWLDAGNETTVATLLAFGLTLFAYVSTTPPADIDAASGFAAFLAFLGIAGLAGRAYEAGATVRASLR